jgi:hypothetical protein
MERCMYNVGDRHFALEFHELSPENNALFDHIEIQFMDNADDVLS